MPNIGPHHVFFYLFYFYFYTDNRDQRANNRLSHTNYNEGHDRGQEHVPEWMDYNPDTKTTTDTNDKPDLNGEYANDLEAWKSSMKKKEGLDDTTDKQPIKQGK